MFVKLNDSGYEHDGIEVLLCDALFMGKFIFRTCVHADWEAPRGSFHREWCSILDVEMSETSSQWFVFHSSSSRLITSLRGKTISRQDRLRLLLGHPITPLEGWVIQTT